MLKNAFLFLVTALCLTACGSDNIEEAELFSENLVENISVETRSGPTGCFEIVYPISIEFPDGTFASANSMEEAKEAARLWKENNPDVEGRPSLAYPIELIQEDGSLISIESRTDLREVIKECRRERFENKKGRHCFRLVYPVSIAFPDGSNVEVEDRFALKTALREWRINNPDAEERPSLEFPVDVEMKEDGSIVTVNSKEELIALKDDCE